MLTHILGRVVPYICDSVVLSAMQESEGSVIEDWEVWGDPREVERRRAERKRSSLPREARLELIARELEQVR